jgi:hypothetical protein
MQGDLENEKRNATWQANSGEFAVKQRTLGAGRGLLRTVRERPLFSLRFESKFFNKRRDGSVFLPMPANGVDGLDHVVIFQVRGAVQFDFRGTGAARTRGIAHQGQDLLVDGIECFRGMREVLIRIAALRIGRRRDGIILPQKRHRREPAVGVGAEQQRFRFIGIIEGLGVLLRRDGDADGKTSLGTDRLDGKEKERHQLKHDVNHRCHVEFDFIAARGAFDFHRTVSIAGNTWQAAR